MDAITSYQQFLQHLERSLAAETFVKLTLSKPGGKDKSFTNVYARRIERKGEPVISFTLRYLTKDVVKNFPFSEAVAIVGLWLGNDFLNGDLYTTEGDFFIRYNKKRQPSLLVKPPRQQTPPIGEHDKAKKRYLPAEGNLYLREMGIIGADGNVLPTGQRKFRQINKYIEIIDAQLQQASLPADAHIVDMGSGKGYLTFALYDYLTNQLGMPVSITGVELRPALVDFCNALTAKAGFTRLHFVAQDINDYQPERINMLIALHACDTATDLAIAKGILAKAEVIVVAPCCHKQIRQQMQSTGALQPILRHGILEERQAELITDGIRALLMEAQGYKTKVFEFVSAEHTSKNLMITGIRSKPKPDALGKVAAIKQQFGIKEHFLERLLPKIADK